MTNELHVYDTTLRDGAQQEGINLTVADKLAIAALLDELGVDYIEGGWPGAIPRDTEFFQLAAKELDLRHAKLAAFGSTTKAGVAAADDPQVAALVESGAQVLTLVAKSDSRHVARALKTTPEENLRMVRDSVTHLVGLGREVHVDREHFFDGYLHDPAHALDVARTALDAGATTAVLCDTNGGTLPDVVHRIVTEVRAETTGRLGIHTHNDAGCAVASSLSAVDAGVTHVQGCINGYGERTGNADLIAVVAALELKKGMAVLGADRLAEATRIAHQIAELTNIPPFTRQPYVGFSTFAHKAGLHASAIRVDPDLYQHIDPAAVGNDMRMIVSDMAGRASIELKGRELGFDLAGRGELLGRVTDRVKAAEARGYTYDSADASFELLLREELGEGDASAYFQVESWRANVTASDGGRRSEAEATVKLRTGQGRIVRTGEGNGPVNALDHALREALVGAYPEIEDFLLVDYRVRILDADQGTDATIRVLVRFTDGVRTWATVGVGTDVVEASWEAIVDALVWGLIHAEVAPR
jgi:2-isopropylmalate synthase